MIEESRNGKEIRAEFISDGVAEAVDIF